MIEAKLFSATRKLAYSVTGPSAANSLKTRIVVAGAAGGKVRSTGHLLGRGAVLSGLYATQRDDYPVTVMTGHSVCEVILDTGPIGYTGISHPDVLIWVAKEGQAKALARLTAMTAADRAYVARDLLDQQDFSTALEKIETINCMDPSMGKSFQVLLYLHWGASLRSQGNYEEAFGIYAHKLFPLSPAIALNRMNLTFVNSKI